VSGPPALASLGRYLLALLLTIAVEGGVAYLFGLRTRRQMLAVAAINTVTNPILNYVLLVLRFLGLDVTLGVVVLLEILVVVAEWRLLVYAVGMPNERSLFLSLLMNTASFLAGVLLIGSY
jgi:hypothetical protein